MHNVTIDANHIYRVDGMIIPSVSAVLDVYFPPTPFYTEEGREDGHYRHEWYAFLSQGGVAAKPPYPKIEPAIEGYKRFMAEVRPEYVFGERPMYHPQLRYCGTPDVVFKLAGRLSVVDYKPKAKNKRTRLQTALYYLMLRANGVMVEDRYELRCYDGIYRLEKHTDAGDIRRAEIMVAAYWSAQFYR